jgi:hypothetical protein
VNRDPARYTLHVTDFAENIEALEAFRTGLKVLNPDARIIVTVSPVPLQVSFTGTDPGVANMLSKSVLRAVAQAMADAHSDVDYFPSYEMVALAPRSKAYAPDCRHIGDAAVSAVIGKFLQSYMGRLPEATDSGFTELGYLAANPDVEAAVRAGELESGFEHWLQSGRAEGRPLLPSEGRTPRMIAAGIGA